MEFKYSGCENVLSVEKNNDNYWTLYLLNKILDKRTRAELKKFFEEFNEFVKTERKPKALIITGAPLSKIFCAGADLKEIKELAENFNENKIKEFVRNGREIMLYILNCPMITIAAINGYAFGGGLELALACDFRLAADSPSTNLLGFPEATFGFPPGFLGTVLLPRLVGLNKSKYLIYGQPQSAKEAENIDLVDKSVFSSDLLSSAQSFAEKFTEIDFYVLKTIKENFRKKRFLGSDDFDFIREMIQEEEDFIKCFKENGEKIKERIDQFLAKSKK